jgi:hypothetical protein
VLLACTIAARRLDLAPLLRRLAADELDWPRLAHAAAWHHLRPALVARLAAAGFEGAPHESFANAYAAAAANAGHARWMAAATLEALEALRAAGVRCVPYKGVAFALAMGLDAAHREMADIDILIDARSAGAAARALATAGYESRLSEEALQSPWLERATPEVVLERAADSLVLELHVRTAPAWYPAPVTAAQVLSSGTEGRMLGRPIPWPRREELLLLHVADALKSLGAGMRWLGDLAVILEREGDSMDWARVAAIARGNGGLDNVRAALRTLEAMGAEAARVLDVPSIAPVLPAAARALAAQARGRPRVEAAVADIARGIGADLARSGAVSSFAWALRISDHGTRTAVAIARYLAGPAEADLIAMPASLPNATLRWRALRRRLGGTA